MSSQPQNLPGKKIWPKTLVDMKKKSQKIVALTAYDYTTALLVEQAEIPLILVGDSLGNTVAGLPNTLAVTMEQMLYHVLLVRRGVQKSLLVADMPYLSYQISKKKALYNAGRLIQESGAEAIKLEGGAADIGSLLPGLVRAKIPVMGHLGLLPQSVNASGGYHVHGKSIDDQKKMIADAKFLEQEGCFAIVLEGIPESLGKEISELLTIPTIGIGAGRYTDGQILVYHDLMGFSEHTPKFVRKYADAHNLFNQALRNFATDVSSGSFPADKECY